MHHVGASSVSLAPTFLQQSEFTYTMDPCSNPDPVSLNSGLAFFYFICPGLCAEIEILLTHMECSMPDYERYKVSRYQKRRP